MLRRYIVLLIFSYSFILGCDNTTSSDSSSTPTSVFDIQVEVKEGSELPTLVVTGNTVTAYFTILNNSSSDESNITVSELPTNVTQVIRDGTYEDTCPAVISLAASAECTLQLTISGAVSSSELLAVCRENAIDCTEVSSLSVRELTSLNITPQSRYFHINNTQQLTATGILADSTTEDLTSQVTWGSSNTAAASVSSAGLVTGVALGNSNITAELGSYTSDATTINVVELRAYIVNRTLNSVSLCTIDPDSDAINECADSGAGTIFNNPIGIRLSVDKTFLYVGNSGNNTVTVCALDETDGTLSDCATSGSGFNQPVRFDFNTDGSLVYIANSGTDTVSVCTVDEDDGSLSDCTSTAGGDILTANDVALDNANAYAYVSDLNSNAVFVCPINDDGLFDTCVDSGAGATFSNTTSMTFNNDSSLVYVNEGTITLCDVNATTGAFSNCQDSGFTVVPGLQQFVINESNTKLYATRSFFMLYTVYMCDVDSNTGLLNNCEDAAGDGSASFTSPTGIELW